MFDSFGSPFPIYRFDRELTEAEAATRSSESEIEALKAQLNKMALVNQALFEIIKVKLDITDEDLRRTIRAVDAGDGREDGQLRPPTLTCPKCQTTVTAGALKCYSCGATLAPKHPFSP